MPSSVTPPSPNPNISDRRRSNHPTMAKKRKLNPAAAAAAAAASPVKQETSDEQIVSSPIDDGPPEIYEQHPVEEHPSDDDEEPHTPESTEEPGADLENENYVNEEDEEGVDPEAVQKILELFPKDQLKDLLGDAASKHPDVLEQIVGLADADPAHRKIFVHGLGWDTTAETLAESFRPYGEIEEINAVTDKLTGKSKGYGFLLFKHRSSAKRALEEPQKKIGSRMTASQLASAGPVPAPPQVQASAPPASEYTQKKIYVSNVGAEVDPQKVLQFFSKYGEIEEGPLGLDKVTGKPKGFCLFVYKAAESARRALEEPHKSFEGRILHCQRAIDGPKSSKQGFQVPQTGVQHGLSFSRNNHTGYMVGEGSNVPAAVAQPSGMGFNQAVQTPAAAAAVAELNPALGQALTALLASQGAGGLTNLLSALGSTGMGGQAVNQAAPSQMMNNSAPRMNPGGMGGYGAMQGGYGNATMGQGSSGRMWHGHGHISGRPPYTGR